jgi:transposase
MGARFVNVDRDTTMLLPPSIQEWLDPDDIVHFVIDAAETMELPQLEVNHRGSGSPRYPPKMMLTLLLSCDANGIMSSRKIETATWHLVPVRYLTGGTHIKANVSKYKNIRYDRISELSEQLDEDIDRLLAEAAAADEADEDDGQRIPAGVGRREEMRAKLREVKAIIEQQARGKEQQRQDREDHGRDDEDPPKKRRNARDARPEDQHQINLIDPDSKLMRTSRRDGWQQAYNAQAVVDADGSQLILGSVATNTVDAWELEPALETIDSEVGTPTAVLADAGYVRTRLIERFEADPERPELFLSITGDDHDLLRYDYRSPKKRTKDVKSPILVAMREKVRSDEGRKIYQKR